MASPTDSRRFPFRLIVPAVLLLAALLFAAVGVDVDEVQQWIANQGNAATFLFVVVGIVMMSTVVPKTAIAVSAGALFGMLTGSLLLLLIATLAAMLNYAIGRWWLRRYLDEKVASSKSPWAAVIREMAAEAGVGFHLLIRLSPIPTMMISYSMGASSARRIPYLIAAIAAVVPHSIWVYSGSSAMVAGSDSGNGLAWLHTAIAITFGLVVGIVVPREAMRRLAKQSGEMET
ncbi:SNARE associated Golgi protein [Planctomycetes bacterium CA13]|uniref:TVP38/TMEM64 family membrane protein n=1 Tax=Novipirellula herctigrandis TaxID=2527986 RepID=A0A5C5Z594_9BACT|nr:SNARE associated Golgi protein [Planctomycetes bacterium CA13]